jgi:hypothetical protein
VQLPLVSDEVIDRLREARPALLAEARALVDRADAGDERLASAAQRHLEALEAHLGLVEALLEAVTPDPIVDGPDSV